MSDWKDDGPLIGWKHETQGESIAYSLGAAVAFGLMGMAEAIRDNAPVMCPYPCCSTDVRSETE